MKKYNGIISLVLLALSLVGVYFYSTTGYRYYIDPQNNVVSYVILFLMVIGWILVIEGLSLLIKAIWGKILGYKVIRWRYLCFGFYLLEGKYCFELSFKETLHEISFYKDGEYKHQSHPYFLTTGIVSLLIAGSILLTTLVFGFSSLRNFTGLGVYSMNSLFVSGLALSAVYFCLSFFPMDIGSPNNGGYFFILRDSVTNESYYLVNKALYDISLGKEYKDLEITLVDNPKNEIEVMRNLLTIYKMYDGGENAYQILEANHRNKYVRGYYKAILDLEYVVRTIPHKESLAKKEFNDLKPACKALIKRKDLMLQRYNILITKLLSNDKISLVERKNEYKAVIKYVKNNL